MVPLSLITTNSLGASTPGCIARVSDLANSLGKPVCTGGEKGGSCTPDDDAFYFTTSRGFGWRIHCGVVSILLN